MVSIISRVLSRLPRLVALIITAALVLPGALAFPVTQGAHATRMALAINLPDGSLIRDSSNGRVYLIWSNRRHWIDSPATFNALGYGGQSIQTLANSVVVSIPDGTVLSLSTVANSLVWPLAPIVANPVHLDLSTPSASPGGTIQLAGSGFGASEQVTLTAPNLTFTVATNGSGSFSVNVPVLSNVTDGLHHIYAQGSNSGRFGVQIFHVIPPAAAPALVFSPNPVALNMPLSVSGTGFTPGETVQVFLAGGAATVSVLAAGNGAFGPAIVTVPGNVGVGNHSLRAYGTSSFHFITGTVNVVAAQAPTPTPSPSPPAPPSPTPVINPAVSLNPSTVSAGAQTVVGGSGFLPGETVLIRFNGSLQQGVSASAAGTFSGVLLTIPVGTGPGTYTVSATGATSGRGGNVSLTVQAPQPSAPPSIAVSPATVPPGSRIQVSGTGFQPGETLLLSFNNGVVQNLTADGTGSFTNGSFIVPANMPQGQFGVSVLGATSGRAANAVLTVTAPPAVPVAHLFVNPATVNPGARVTIGGSGYAARETVLLRIDGGLVTAVAADGAGSFSVGYTVHLGIGGHTVTATGAATGRTSSAGLRVAQPVTPGLGLVPSRVHRGGAVAVNGNNFIPFETVLIRFRGALVQGVAADGNGRFFNARFTVPGNAPYGLSTVTITGSRSGRTASARLDVTPAPAAGPRIKLSSGSLHRGNTETVSGSGFIGGEIVLIRFRGGLAQAAVADRHGNFSRASFRIPVNSPYGVQAITATGARSGRTAKASVRINPLPPRTSISISPKRVRQNGTVTVTGQGFTKGEIVLVRLHGVLVQAPTADSHGKFHTSFRVPGGRFKGANVVLATGARSGHHAQTTLVVV